MGVTTGVTAGVTTGGKLPWWVRASISGKFNLQRKRVNHRDTMVVTMGAPRGHREGHHRGKAPVVGRGLNLRDTMGAPRGHRGGHHRGKASVVGRGINLMKI